MFPRGHFLSQNHLCSPYLTRYHQYKAAVFLLQHDKSAAVASVMVTLFSGESSVAVVNTRNWLPEVSDTFLPIRHILDSLQLNMRFLSLELV